MKNYAASYFNAENVLIFLAADEKAASEYATLRGKYIGRTVQDMWEVSDQFLKNAGITFSLKPFGESWTWIGKDAAFPTMEDRTNSYPEVPEEEESPELTEKELQDVLHDLLNESEDWFDLFDSNAHGRISSVESSQSAFHQMGGMVSKPPVTSST